MYTGMQPLRELDVIGRGIDSNPINNIRLYENPRSVVVNCHGQKYGSWDADTFFGIGGYHDKIWLTAQTTSGHIKPFVNGKIDPNSILVLYNNGGNEVLRKKIGLVKH